MKQFRDRSDGGGQMHREEAFLQAIGSVPEEIRQSLMQLPPEVRQSCTEVRLRRERPVTVQRNERVQLLCPGGRLSDRQVPDNMIVSGVQIERMFQRLCAYSVHSYQSQIRAGYLTLPGGHRVGLCGRAVTENGQLQSVREISSLTVRISRRISGAADRVLYWASPQQYDGILLAGPPGSGKTTILRDMAHQLARPGGMQVAVIDEKGELSGGESPGICCDVLYGYPKAEGIQQAVRNLAPQVIISDEIGTVAEFNALAEGICTGVRMVASVHGGNEQTLYERPVIRKMLESGGFCRVVLLGGGVGQIKAVYQVEGKRNEIYGTDFTLCRVYGMGVDAFPPAG
jgi:stage III sporulation protein AA